MGIRETKLPSIPEPTQDNYLEVIQKMKEVIEVGVLSIRRGDSLDSNVTYRNLYDIFAKGSAGGGGSNFLPTPPIIRPPDDGPFPPPVDVPGDLPGRPTNVSTNAVWDGIMIRWDWPTEPNTHWERAAVHASSTPLFVDGGVVGYTATNMFVHSGLGLSEPNPDNDGTSQTGVRYYWVRYEANDAVTGEVISTEWSPYNYEPGVYGKTATDITLTIESFILGSSSDPTLSPIAPFVIGKITVGYTDGGDPIQVDAIGFSGDFLIDGTITARAIQAQTIGAREILAESVWAELVTATRVIAHSFTTRPRETYDFRLEINGEGGSFEPYPLWYGRGDTGGPEGTFWFQNYNILDGDALKRVTSMFLNGQLFVTGGGYFYGGNITYDLDDDGDPSTPAAVQRDMRIEIGGAGSDFILWAGSGLTGVGTGEPDDESQPIFFIDKDGNAVFRGTVDALFVSGEISRTYIIQEWGEWIPGNQQKDKLENFVETDWFQISTSDWVLPEPPFATGHVPTINMVIKVYGDKQAAGATRISYKETVDGDWTRLAWHVHSIFHYGGSRSIQEVLPKRVYGKVWFKLDIASFDSPGKGSTEFANPQGLIMGVR